MKATFWKNKWDLNQIGFHQNRVNPYLIKHFDALNMKKGDTIFVPLCGKTLDIKWLIQQGIKVIGAELIESAVEQLFMEMQVKPEIHEIEKFKYFSAENVVVFVGDILELNSKLMGNIDAIYDRAALVALPQEVRVRYASHMLNITQNASQLLITFDYDQSLMSGPPFSVNRAEVFNLYGEDYQIDSLEIADVKGGLKGIYAATEHIWHLK